MSLWDLFHSLFGRKDEDQGEQSIEEEADEIGQMALDDPDFDAYASMGNIPDTPHPGEDEPDTGEHPALPWWMFWRH